MNERITTLEQALVILRNARIAAYLAGNDTGMLKCAAAERHLNRQLRQMIEDERRWHGHIEDWRSRDVAGELRVG